MLDHTCTVLCAVYTHTPSNSHDYIHRMTVADFWLQLSTKPQQWQWHSSHPHWDSGYSRDGEIIPWSMAYILPPPSHFLVHFFVPKRKAKHGRAFLQAYYHHPVNMCHACRSLSIWFWRAEQYLMCLMVWWAWTLELSKRLATVKPCSPWGGRQHPLLVR